MKTERVALLASQLSTPFCPDSAQHTPRWDKCKQTALCLVSPQSSFPGLVCVRSALAMRGNFEPTKDLSATHWTLLGKVPRSLPCFDLKGPVKQEVSHQPLPKERQTSEEPNRAKGNFTQRQDFLTVSGTPKAQPERTASPTPRSVPFHQKTTQCLRGFLVP